MLLATLKNMGTVSNVIYIITELCYGAINSSKSNLDLLNVDQPYGRWILCTVASAIIEISLK